MFIGTAQEAIVAHSKWETDVGKRSGYDNGDEEPARQFYCRDAVIAWGLAILLTVRLLFAVGLGKASPIIVVDLVFCIYLFTVARRKSSMAFLAIYNLDVMVNRFWALWSPPIMFDWRDVQTLTIRKSKRVTVTTKDGTKLKFSLALVKRAERKEAAQMLRGSAATTGVAVN